MNLKEQLFDCLPAGRYALSGLLRLVDVVETEAVATAAVECHAQPRLFINPGFVARHAATPEKLMMLVLHEIHHVLLGHTRRFAASSLGDNFVFDCVINALLCRMFPQPEYTALFRDFYREDVFPECLLRPPAGWDPMARKVPVPAALDVDSLGPARQVYQGLYSTEGATYHDIHQVLRAFMAGHGSALVGVALLGEHDGSAQGGSTAGDTLFAAAVAGIVRQWPSPPEPMRGVSMDEMLRSSKLTVSRPSRRAQLRGLIGRIAGTTPNGLGALRPTPSDMLIDTPTPCFDRRALVSRAFGATPLLYRTAMPTTATTAAQERVHIYVDVSGSMEDILGALYGAVLDCSSVVHPQVHLFSTQVVEASTAQLRAGFCRSTNGTDIRCVTQHMARHKVRRAILLTDGYVGEPDAAGRTVLERTRVGVAYAGRHTTDQHLGRHADAAIDLAGDPR